MEAITLPNKKFTMAVQWHPEFLWEDSKENNTIIRAFVEVIDE